jgi:hypothetical protein
MTCPSQPRVVKSSPGVASFLEKPLSRFCAAIFHAHRYEILVRLSWRFILADKMTRRGGNTSREISVYSLIGRM